jgi:integrase/recombinase XerD
MPLASFLPRKNIDDLRNKFSKIPESYFQKLELKKYAYMTAKNYASCFERFIRYFPKHKLLDIREDKKLFVSKANS